MTEDEAGSVQPKPSSEDPPKPPRSPVPANYARKEIRDAKELEGDPAPGVGSDSTGAETFSRFLTFYPCTRFFCAVAHKQFPSSHRPETRVARLREHHPKFYGFCIAVDLLLVVTSAILLLTVAGVAAYKTVWLGT